MLESLDINGRRYVPVDRAAHETGYAAAYITRLARDKWVDASFVQGDCFVDVDSFNTFIVTAEADTYRQLQQATQREQAELAYQQYEAAQAALVLERSDVMIFGKLGVVVVCGLLVAVLAYSTIDAEVTLADLTAGTSQAAAVIAEHMLPATIIDWFTVQ